MSIFESITEGLGNLLETVKDIPTEKIAVVGLVVLGAGAIAKDLVQGNFDDAVDKLKSVID